MLIKKAATTLSSTLAENASQGESAATAYLNMLMVSSGDSLLTKGFEHRSSLIYSWSDTLVRVTSMSCSNR